MGLGVARSIAKWSFLVLPIQKCPVVSLSWLTSIPEGRKTPVSLVFVLLFQLCSETVGLPNAAGVEDVEVTGHFWVFFPFSPEDAAWEPLRRAAVLTAVRCKSVIILSATEKTQLDDSSPRLLVNSCQLWVFTGKYLIQF